ncbi:MAG: leucine-rich repeat protein [Bacillota bacterium]|nr:leucine-rich repeat protein [Bacillota bacterium]
MKKLLALALTLCMLCTLVPTFALADYGGSCGDNLRFEVKGSVLTISGTGEMKDFESTEYSSKAPWYSSCSRITEIIIENGVESIGNRAFKNFNSLTKVTIPETVTEIGAYAFRNCGMTEISIPGSVKTIGNNAFWECKKLTSVTLNEGLVRIGAGAFSDCKSLSSISIPKSVECVDGEAFYNTSALTQNEYGQFIDTCLVYAPRSEEHMEEYSIPEGTELIASDAFYFNQQIGTLKIPASLINISPAAFSCKYLGKIVVDENNPCYCDVDGVLFTKDMKTLLKCPDEITGVYTVPDGVETIADEAFWEAGISGIVFPESMKTIGAQAFRNSSIESVNIPDGVEIDTSSAFYGCEKLKNVYLSSGIGEIGTYMFYGCSALETVFIEEGITSIGIGAFSCSGVKTVYVPDSVKSIKSDAFSDCKNLENIYLGNGLESIGNYAFQCCGKLSSIHIPNSVTGIGSGAFKNSGLKYIEFPAELKYVNPEICCGCSKLEYAVIPTKVESIGNWAFEYCNSMTEVYLPLSLKTVGEEAFTKCTSLTYVIYEGSSAQYNNIELKGMAYYGSNDGLINAPYLTYSADYHIHSYTAVNISGTCVTDGYRNNVCICGDSYKNHFTLAEGHHMSDGVCSVCGVGENTFEDVKEGSVYYDSVLWAYYHSPQITGGFTPTEFHPGKDCTRAQVVTFLWRAAGCPEPETEDCPFEDVKNEGSMVPYYKAILWAAESGITKGTDATHFSPQTPVTRAQFVTFLYRYNGKPDIISQYVTFSDVNANSVYAPAIMWAVEQGITNGYGANEFRPDMTCTRWHVVTFIFRNLA